MEQNKKEMGKGLKTEHGISIQLPRDRDATLTPHEIMALRHLLQPFKCPHSTTWHLVIAPDPLRYKGFQVR